MFDRIDIVKYQNVANFAICCFVANVLYTNSSPDNVLILIFAHFLLDFSFAQKDIKLHHFFGILILSFKFYYGVKPEDDTLMLSTVIATEISTFFYVFKLWMQELKGIPFIKPVAAINDAAFFATFFKYRIYDYGLNVIQQPNEWLQKYTQGRWERNLWIYAGIYGLYALNIYWFAIMCKIVAKPIIRKIDEKRTILFEHDAVSYAQFATLGVITKVYIAKPAESYIFDIIGVAGLAIASMTYHQTARKLYNKNNMVDYTSDELVVEFIKDQLAIHARSFLAAVSALYYVENKNWILFLATFHLGSASRLVYFAWDSNRRGITFNNENKEFLAFVNMTTCLPIAIDITIIAICSHSPNSAIRLAEISWIMFVVLTVVPFYNLNHIAFHACLIAQGCFVAKCNLRE